MKLDTTELGRLATIQREPLRHIERRIEEVKVVDDLHYAATVTQQFTVPFLNKNKRTEARSDKHLLVPLGWFVKDRLPDIQVLDENNSLLPFLRRRDQGIIGAILFTSEWEPVLFADRSKNFQNHTQAIWNTMLGHIERIVTSSRESAQLLIYNLRQLLGECKTSQTFSPDIRSFASFVLRNNQFWLSLKTLAEVRLLVTQMRGRPGKTYVVTIKYTERLPARPPRPPAARHLARQEAFRNPAITIRRVVRRSLVWLGAGSTGIARKANNLGQAASLWIIFAMPEGVEPVRCFWSSTRADVPSENKISNNIVNSLDITKAAAGKYHEPGHPPKIDELVLDVQIEPSSAITSAAGLAFLLYIVGAYVYKAMPQLRLEQIAHEQLAHKHIYQPSSDYTTRLVGIGAILAATPAAIAGALAYRGHTFVRTISRGPRIMLSLLSALGASLAVVLSLHGPGSFAEVLAFILSVYSLGITGVFLFIRFGPRWRKSERSRRRLVTEKASPNKCRQRQAYQALACLLPWMALALSIAVSQAALQREHVFGRHFPQNVWRVWSPV